MVAVSPSSVSNIRITKDWNVSLEPLGRLYSGPIKKQCVASDPDVCDLMTAQEARKAIRMLLTDDGETATIYELVPVKLK